MCVRERGKYFCFLSGQRKTMIFIPLVVSMVFSAASCSPEEVSVPSSFLLLSLSLSLSLLIKFVTNNGNRFIPVTIYANGVLSSTKE